LIILEMGSWDLFVWAGLSPWATGDSYHWYFWAENLKFLIDSWGLDYRIRLDWIVFYRKLNSVLWQVIERKLFDNWFYL
jgi:hypothetical protein